MIKRFRSIVQDVQSFLSYLRTYGYRIHTAYLFALIIALFTFGILCYHSFDSTDVKIYCWTLYAKMVQVFRGEHASLYGESASSWLRKTELIFQWTNKKLWLFAWYGLAAGLTALKILTTLAFFFFKRNQKNSNAQEARLMAGSSLCSKTDLIKMIERNKEASPLLLMDLPLIKNTETENILIIGTTGSGKTNALKHIANQLPDQKVIIVDTKGELVYKYYNAARGDIIMNPFDSRYPGWDSSKEYGQEAHYDELEKSIVPHANSDSSLAKSPISIKEWTENDTQTGWLFLSMTRGQHITLAPLFSYWLSLAMKSRREGPSSKQRPIWFMIDELSSLPKITDLALFLSETSQYGACMVLCIQNLEQLETIYSPQIAQMIFEFCATKILFPCTSDAAQELSQKISDQIQHGKQNKISPRELIYLPNLVSCVQLSHGYPITKIKWAFTP